MIKSSKLIKSIGGFLKDFAMGGRLTNLPEDIYFERHVQIINGGYMKKAEEFIKNIKVEAIVPEGVDSAIELCKHIIVMGDDDYLSGHPEWNEIEEEAHKVLAELNKELGTKSSPRARQADLNRE